MAKSSSAMAEVQEKFDESTWAIAIIIARIIDTLGGAQKNRLLVTFNEYLSQEYFTEDGQADPNVIFENLRIKFWGESYVKIEKDRARSFHRV